MIGHLEMLETSPDFAGTTMSSLHAIDRGARRMVRVVDDLLLLAKVGDPENPVIPVPVDLRELVDDVVDLTTVAAEQKGVTVRVARPRTAASSRSATRPSWTGCAPTWSATP